MFREAKQGRIFQDVVDRFRKLFLRVNSSPEASCLRKENLRSYLAPAGEHFGRPCEFWNKKA